MCTLLLHIIRCVLLAVHTWNSFSPQNNGSFVLTDIRIHYKHTSVYRISCVRFGEIQDKQRDLQSLKGRLHKTSFCHVSTTFYSHLFFSTSLLSSISIHLITYVNERIGETESHFEFIIQWAKNVFFESTLLYGDFNRKHLCKIELCRHQIVSDEIVRVHDLNERARLMRFFRKQCRFSIVEVKPKNNTETTTTSNFIWMNQLTLYLLNSSRLSTVHFIFFCLQFLLSYFLFLVFASFLLDRSLTL